MAKTKTAGMYKRNDGLYSYRFTVDGKRYAVYGATMKECKQKELEKREQIESGTYKKGKALTVSEYFQRWLDSREGAVSSATMRTYWKLANRMKRQKIDKAGHTFGELKLSALETENIRELLQ